MKENREMEKLFSGAGQQKVAVIGGGGFIGRSLVRKLVATGHVVRVGSQNPEKIQGLGKARGTGRVEFLKTSVEDKERQHSPAGRETGDGSGQSDHHEVWGRGPQSLVVPNPK